MKKLIGLGLLLVCFACNNNTTEENKTDSSESTELTEKVTEINALSIYNLPSTWVNQNNEAIELKDLNGNVLVAVMIYTTCKAACPRLVADMKNIEAKVSETAKGNVKYLLFSIDPETDTPEHLKKFAIENKMNTDQWVFLRGTEETTLEFANVLAVKYKKISPVDFSHSNIISVFNKEGVLAHQQEGLGVDNNILVSKVIELAK
jgi:protein SCO1